MARHGWGKRDKRGEEEKKRKARGKTGGKKDKEIREKERRRKRL